MPNRPILSHEYNEYIPTRHAQVFRGREQVSQGSYGTNSGYVRELIRKDQDRLYLRGLLLAGAASAPAVPVDPAYFEALRNRMRKAAEVGAHG